MERDQLIALLTGTDEATAQCREALHGRASFTVTSGTMPARQLAVTYDRRERHCRARGLPTMGFRQGVERLQAAQDQKIRLGWVDVPDPPYRFHLFLAEDFATVVACIGIDQALQTGSLPEAE